MSLKAKVRTATDCWKRYPMAWDYTKEARVGLELEFEGWKPLVRHQPMGWRLVNDGSLRNSGVEFVSPPLLWADVEPSLEYLYNEVLPESPTLETNSRCGFHMHFNCLNLSTGQLYSLICAHTLVEPGLFRTYAPHRETSAFCVPTYEHHTMIHILARANERLRIMPGSKEIQALKDASKYSAFNVGSLFKFGTVENRIKQCSMDYRELLDYSKVLMRLYESATLYYDPLAVVEDYERLGPIGFSRHLVGPGINMNEGGSKEKAAWCAAVMIAGCKPKSWQDMDWEEILNETRRRA